jgi:hypothetical protein
MIDVLQLWKVNLPTYQTEVDATAADITWTSETLNNMVFVRDYCETYDANKKASFEIKASFFNGPEGGAVSDFPTTAAAVIPNPPLVGGVLFTLRDMAARFKLAPDTSRRSASLGIAGGERNRSRNRAAEHRSIRRRPVLCFRSSSQTAANRTCGRSSCSPSAPPAGTSQAAARQSADITYSPGGETNAVQLQVRVQLRKSNANYGQPSAIVLVTVNP